MKCKSIFSYITMLNIYYFQCKVSSKSDEYTTSIHRTLSMYIPKATKSFKVSQTSELWGHSWRLWKVVFLSLNCWQFTSTHNFSIQRREEQIFNQIKRAQIVFSFNLHVSINTYPDFFNMWNMLDWFFLWKYSPLP